MATSSKRACATGCVTQISCNQSPCPCGRPLLTCTFLGDNETQFWLRLCGVSGSWCAQGLFEPSEHLWQVWGLILNAILPLQPSCWSFSFALGCGVFFATKDGEALYNEKKQDWKLTVAQVMNSVLQNSDLN